MKKLLLIIFFITNCSLLFASKLVIYNDFVVFYNGNVEATNATLSKTNEMFSNIDEYYIELYYSYPDTSFTMKFRDEDSIYCGKLEFELQIDSVNSNGESKLIKMEKWHTEFNLKNDFNNDSGKVYQPQDFYGVRRIYLLTGHYKATLTVTDANSNLQSDSSSNNKSRIYKHNFDIEVKPILPKTLAISGLQITNNIIPKQTASNDLLENKAVQIFYKNQCYVYPNPLREISAETPILHIYSEIYGGNYISPEGLVMNYTIRNSKNNTEFEYSRNKPAIADAIIDAISIPLDLMQSGVYTIEVQVFSSNRKDSAKSTNTFYLINDNVEISDRTYYVEEAAFDLSEFATITEEKSELEFDQFSVIASKEEINTWDKLTSLKAKQRFLYRFWFDRNPDLNNPYNTKLAEFRERMKYVNTYFSHSGNTNGWKTDRGKIYLKYGTPDDREIKTATPEKKAYEIWLYNSLEGGGQFYFADIFGMENHKLVHSTISGFIKNYNWENLISNTSN